MKKIKRFLRVLFCKHKRGTIYYRDERNNCYGYYGVDSYTQEDVPNGVKIKWCSDCGEQIIL